MWRTQVHRTFQEVLCNMKESPQHHGAWFWIKNKMPRIAEMNRNTFFRVYTAPDEVDVQASIFIKFGDLDNTMHEIPTAGLTCEQLEEILKGKHEFGKTLNRAKITVNEDREIPQSVIESRKFIKHLHDMY